MTDDIALTSEQRLMLDNRQREVRYKNGVRAYNGLVAWNRMLFDQRVLKDRAGADLLWPVMRENPLFMFGLALYIGEGDKVGSCIGVTNSDPRVLVKAIEFMQMLGCPMDRLRVNIILHRGENPENAVRYWSTELGVPRSSFNRVTPSKISGGSRAVKLLFGTARVRVSAASIRRKIDRWMELALGGT
jgi:hypothetical protein